MKKDTDKKNGHAVVKKSRSLETSRTGVRTAHQFASTMSDLMVDLLDGSVSPQVGNAVCKAGGMLLRVAELDYRVKNGGPKKDRRGPGSFDLIPVGA